MKAMINVRRIDVVLKEISPLGWITIDGGKILETGHGHLPYDNCEVIDGHGNYLVPGLIDAHCHLGMFEDGMGFEGEDGNEMTDPITPELRAIDGVNPMDRCFSEALSGGVTCVCTGPGSANVLGGQFATLKTAGRSVDKMIVQAPAAMKSAFGENPKRTYQAQSKSPSTRMAIAASLREAFYKAQEYLDKKNSAEPGEGPDFHFAYESLIPVLQGTLPLKAHAHRADDILTAIRIAKEFNIALSIEHCTEGHLIVEELIAAGFPAVVGPGLTTRSKIELRDLDFSTVGILNRAGIPVAIMTDHPVVPIQYLNLCAGLAAKAGMDRWEALRSITLYPAEILGLGSRLGSLCPGKDADFALWSEHPFQWEGEVLQTWISGETVYRKDGYNHG